jgi:hypothetical protein
MSKYTYTPNSWAKVAFVLAASIDNYSGPSLQKLLEGVIGKDRVADLIGASDPFAGNSVEADVLISGFHIEDVRSTTIRGQAQEIMSAPAISIGKITRTL